MTWKHLPNGHTDLESYLCSLAQEAACSVQNISSAGAQSGTSNGTTTASGSSRRVSMTVCSTMLRYGMTSKPSTVNPGAGWSMSLPPASPASRSALPESSKRGTTSETAGLIPFALLEKPSQDSAFWRTYQASLLPLMGISAPYSESWPKAGTMHGGVCYLRPKWERRISEIGSGLWPTPRVAVTSGKAKATKTHGWDLPAAVKDSLEKQPKALWPTPKGSPSGPDFARMGREKSGGDDLATAVVRAMFPSPARRDWRSGKGRKDNDHTPQLPEVVGGQLNPTWVEWLMGWPQEWTALKPLATDRFHKWLQQHGDYLPQNYEEAAYGP